MSTKSTTELDTRVGAVIKARRLALGLSQQKLAAGLGITFPQVQKYENGTNRVSVSRLTQTAEILRISPLALFAQATGDTSPVTGDPYVDRLRSLLFRVPPAKVEAFFGLVAAAAALACEQDRPGHEMPRAA